VPGISWVLAYTIAAELGDINRFPTPRKLAGYSGLCPRVYQSGERDLRGPLSKQSPRYLRWALVEAATHACTHPALRERYTQTKTRIGKQRGAKVAQIDLARRLAEAIWHMLSRDQPLAPKGATDPWPPDGPQGAAPPERTPTGLVLFIREAIAEISPAPNRQPHRPP
jgi:transposase